MDPTPSIEHTDDWRLAQSVIAGDEAAWRRFVTERTGVIFAVLRRYLFDEDDIRDVYVDVLASLRRGRLAEYAGRSSLATWLVCVARGAAVDHLRHTLGRRTDPAGLEDLDAVQREAYRLYYAQGLAFEDVRLRLRQSGLLAPDASLAEVLAAVEDRLSHRTLRRIAWDLHAASVGAVSGRLAEYLDDATAAMSEHEQQASPEAQLLAREARVTIDKVLALVDRLPDEEREVLRLRFDQGHTADRIAEDLGLPDRRRVYTIAERALARLRRWMKASVCW